MEKDTSFYIETDILTPSDHPTHFTIEVSGLYIDPEKGPERICIGNAAFTNPMIDLYNSNITNDDGADTGTVTVRTENEIPLICCSVHSVHNILLDHTNENHIDNEENYQIYITASVNNPVAFTKRESKIRRIQHKSRAQAFSKELDVNASFLLPWLPGESSQVLLEVILLSRSTGRVSVLGSATVDFDNKNNEVEGREVAWDANNFTVAEIEYGIRWMLAEDLTDVPQFNMIQNFDLRAEKIMSRLNRTDLDITSAAIKAANKNNSVSDSTSSGRERAAPNPANARRGSGGAGSGAGGVGSPLRNLLTTTPAIVQRPRALLAPTSVHEGVLHPICGDFASQMISYHTLGSYSNLHEVISNTSPRESNMPELWDIINSALAMVIGGRFGSLEALRSMEIELDRILCRRLQVGL